MTLRAILGFALVTADLPRLVQFYREVLGFALEGEEGRIPDEEMVRLGLAGAGWRQGLSLGRQNVAVERFERPGRPYPADSDAASLCFQHLAIVVPDIAAAHARLRDITAISRGGPQRLPAAAGGVGAFKFRDPDGHPLELLQFPADAMPAHWRGRQPASGQIGLGIDHSAISVADPEASVAFYRARGLVPGERTINRGPAQERLDARAGVEVAVVPMRPHAAPPHLELLGYRAPARDRAPAMQANDIAATRIVWRSEAAALLRDPDGHLQQTEP